MPPQDPDRDRAATDEAATDDRARDLADRRAALDRATGALTGVYQPGYLDELRADWPE